MRSDHGNVGIVRTVARLAASRMRAKNLRLLAHGKEKREAVLAIEAAVLPLMTKMSSGVFGGLQIAPPIPAQPDDRIPDSDISVPVWMSQKCRHKRK
jgi:hypothetical protein